MLRIGVIMYQTSLTKGQELVAQRMVKEFRRLGHEAFLITGVFQDSEQVVTPDEVKRRGGYVHVFDVDLGIPVVRVNSDNTSWPPRRISFVDFVGTLTGIVDDLKLNVLITHSTLWNGPEEVVKFVEWRRKMLSGGAPGSPVIYCHMSHFQEASEERYALVERSFRETWNTIILPQVLGQANVILVTTPYEASFMKNLGADDEKFFLFPGGVEDEEIAVLGEEGPFRKRFELGNAKLVSFLGSVEERKNPYGLFEVAKLLAERKDIRIVIAGRAEGSYGQMVKEEASKLPNVPFLGSISEEDKAALIRTSMANITLSRSESLGISQLEFMSAGIPVITSGAGGQAWVVRDGWNGVVLNGPEDTKGAAAAILELADNPKLRDKLGRAARGTGSRYSLTRLVDRLAKRLESEVGVISKERARAEGMVGDEKVIEAWVSGGKRVAATSKRLIVRSVKSGKEVTSVPYEEISKIVQHSEAPWAVLGVGAVATGFLLFSRLVGLNLVAYAKPLVLSLLPSLRLPIPVGTLDTILPFLPVAVAGLAFLVAIKRGYLVFYGRTGKLFLPAKFVNALRLADKLTSKELFVTEKPIPAS